jgi:hypothetical protein
VLVARRTRTRADIQRLYADFENMQLMELVCKEFCAGRSPTEIRKIVQEELGETLSRERPYQLLSAAAMNNLLQYVAPLDYQMARELQQAYPWLQGVEVVQTSDVKQVPARAAKVLLQLVRQAAHDKRNAGELHIGLAGGGTVLDTVKVFGELLQRPPDDLPKKLVFHAMVTGLQVDDPTTDPNTFFNYLKSDAVKTEFVAFHGPALPTAKMIADLDDHPPTKEAKDKAKNIDIVVTSGTSWQDSGTTEEGEEHSLLKRLILKYSKKDAKALVRELEKKHGCVVDMLWQPLNAEEPIVSKTPVQAMVLWTLEVLETAIRTKETRVLLILSPCRSCGEPRTDVLRTILNLRQHYVTHVVADVETARIGARQAQQST